MSIRLSPETEEFVRRQVESGAFPDIDAVCEAGVGLLRRRTDLIARLKEGRRQLDAGEFTEYDEAALEGLFADLKRRAGLPSSTADTPAAP